MVRSFTRWAASAAVLLAGLLAMVGLTSPAAGAADAPALIRAAHFSPDTPGVDVYLTGFAGGAARLWVPNAVYGAVTPYSSIPAGLYVVSMRAHGAPATSKPVISWNLDLKSGQAYTTAAIGSAASLRSIVLHDDLSLPASGTGKVRLIQAASRASRADVVAVGGPTVANQTAFATTTKYTSVKAGTWSLRATSVTAPTVSTSAKVSVASGAVSSVLLLDAPGGGITLRSVVDAAGAGVMPVGAVPAGGGGTAGGSAGGPNVLWLALLCPLFAGGAVLRARRLGR